MTPRQMIYRKELIKKIHIHPGYLNMKNQGVWAEFLTANFGEESSAALGISELSSLLDYLNGTGPIKKDPESRSIYRHKRAPTRTAKMASEKQQHRIDRLWALVADTPTEKALREFIHRITGTRPLYLYHLSVTEAQKVIVALESWQKRLEEKDGA